MKTTFLLLILAGLTYIYFHDPAAPNKGVAQIKLAPPRSSTIAAQAPIVALAPSSYARWKTGPTAQNDWKTGSNAQTEFEPFAPSLQATWNETPGYTIVSGAGRKSAPALRR